MNRRPIQLIHPVWNIDQCELTFDSIANQIDKEGLGDFNVRAKIRLCLIELSESRITNLNSNSIIRLQKIGVEIVRINPEQSMKYLNEFLSEKERQSLRLDVGGIGAAREACTIISVNHLDLSDNPIIWFLDDDLQFRQLRCEDDGSLSLDHHQNLFEDVWSFHERNPSAVASLGGVTGCPPLPASSSLLCNLQDLFSYLNQQNPPSSDNSRWDIPDYYYDLSENPSRIEVNFPNPDWEPFENYRDALLCHGSLFRPVVLTQNRMNNTESERIVRGGNTLIYDLETFVLNPYPTLELTGLRTRRGDTIWSCITTFVDGKQILSHNMLLHHGRDSIHWDEHQRKRFIERMLADLYGAAYYRTISSANKKGNFEKIDDILNLTKQLLIGIRGRATKHISTLNKVEEIARKIGENNSENNHLSSEILSISRDARTALEEIPSEEELHVALVESWSRSTLWKDDIGPRLCEKLGLTIPDVME